MPALEQLVDVLPALLVAAAGHVRVGQLVDQRDIRPPGQHGVQVHLGEGGAAVLDRAPRHHLQVADHLRGVLPAVRLDEPGNHIGAALVPAPTLAEHRVGLADARRRPEVDPQVPAGRAAHAPIVPQPVPASAAFSSTTLTRASPRNPSSRPWVCSSTSSRTRPVSSPRSRATRLTWIAAYSGLMCGSSPLPLAVSASAGTSSGATPSSAATVARRSWIAATRSSLFGTELGRGAAEAVVVDRGRPGLEPLRVRLHHRLTLLVDLGLTVLGDLPGVRLADQVRADVLAVDLDQRAVRVVVEQRLARSRHRHRVHDAEREGEHRHRTSRDAELAYRTGKCACHDQTASQPMPGIRATSRSMSLMPMNGRTRPPTP